MEDFSIEGQWWHQDDPSRKVPGRLSYSTKNGIYLDLFQGFTIEPQNSKYNILGVSGDEIYTVFDCTKHAVGPHTATIIFKGMHFNSFEKTLFKDLRIHFQDFNSWFITHFMGVDITRGSSLPLRSFFFNSRDAVVKIGCNVYPDMFRHHHKEWKDTSFVEINLEHEIPFYDYYDYYVKYIKDFIGFVFGFFLNESKVFGRTLSNDEFEIIYRSFDYYQKPLSRGLVGTKSSSDLYERVYLYYPEFEKLCIEHEASLREFLATSKVRSLYRETVYIMMITALESYHRKKYNKKYIKKSEYKNIADGLISKINKGINDKIASNLESSIRFANHYNLKDILEDCLERSCKLVKARAGANKITAEVLRNTRNYLTHLTENKKKIIKGSEINKAIKFLYLLFINIILRDIGVDESEIEKCLEMDFSNFYLLD